MTDKQLEVAARKLCTLRNEDPDAQWTARITNWEMAKIHIESFVKSRDNAHFIEAIAFARDGFDEATQRCEELLPQWLSPHELALMRLQRAASCTQPDLTE